jgi:Lrp/AsnC family transcriptional regulator, leucine-responsive regulatory protein
MPSAKIDETDRRILEQLQRDGRLSNLELAEKVGLSPSPCLRRLRRLEETGVIEGYGAKVNRKKLGLGLLVFVLLKLERYSDADPQVYRDRFSAMPDVIACHLISGTHDFLIQVIAKDLDAYRRFTLERLLKVPGIGDLESSFVIETMKETTSIPIRHLA